MFFDYIIHLNSAVPIRSTRPQLVVSACTTDLLLCVQARTQNTSASSPPNNEKSQALMERL